MFVFIKKIYLYGNIINMLIFYTHIYIYKDIYSITYIHILICVSFDYAIPEPHVSAEACLPSQS